MVEPDSGDCHPAIGECRAARSGVGCGKVKGMVDSGDDGAGDLRSPAGGGHGVSARGIPRQWHWLVPVVVIASVAAWLAGVSSGLVAGRGRVVLMVAGALFTAIAAGVPLWQQGRAARSRADAVATAEAARASMRIAMEDALDPFVALLLQAVSARAVEPARLRGEAIQLALTTLAHLSVFASPEDGGPPRIRVCLFVLDPGPPRRLVPQSYAGRSGAPTVVFDETTRAGQMLLRTVDDGWLSVEDTRLRRTTPWWDEERAYRTYAAGPVPGPEGVPVGLLTLDALASGELSGLDLPLVRLVAHMLSLAFQI